MKNYIKNLLVKLVGADALLIRIETLDTLVACQRNRIEELEKANSVDYGFLTEEEVDRAISTATEDFITERDLERSIEEQLRDYEFDDIVADALSCRACVSTLEEMVQDELKNTDFNDLRGFNESVVRAVEEQLESESNSGDAADWTLTNAINAATENAVKHI